MAAKKHKIKLLATTPMGRRGDVVEVTRTTPHVEWWLNNGVAEYVEEAKDAGVGDDGPGGDSVGDGGSQS